MTDLYTCRFGYGLERETLGNKLNLFSSKKQGRMDLLLVNRDKTANYLIIKYNKLESKEYKSRHASVRNCAKIWNLTIYQMVYGHNRIRLSLKKKKKKKKRWHIFLKKWNCSIVDFAVPGEHMMKDSKKRDKYLDLACEVRKLRKMKVSDTVVPDLLGLVVLEIRRRMEIIHTAVYIYIYIYIYIFTNQLSTSIHGTRKKQKNPGQEQEKKISRITVQRKKKKVFRVKKKEKTNLVLLLEKKIKGYLVSGQKKTKKPSENTAML